MSMVWGGGGGVGTEAGIRHPLKEELQGPDSHPRRSTCLLHTDELCVDRSHRGLTPVTGASRP